MSTFRAVIGGYSHREGSIETRGLASQSRPEGHILCHPHRSNPQKVPQMSSSGENIYQFTCLPFGLSLAPWVFTKTLKPVLALFREMDMCLVAYIDDILILEKSKEMALDHAEGMVYLLEYLGFVINKDKSVLVPGQMIEFLGLMIDTINMELLLPPHKIKMIRVES